MPQMRGVMTSASLGSRPTRICSKPRYIVPTHQASVTVFPSSSNLISTSPSTRFKSILIIRRGIFRVPAPAECSAGRQKDDLALRKRRWFLLRNHHLAEQRLVQWEFRADTAD